MKSHVVRGFDLLRFPADGSLGRLLLVLNDAPFAFGAETLRLLERCGDYYCADGSGNRLLAQLRRLGAEAARPPRAIVGDLDSLGAAARAFFAARGTALLRRPDQDFNDLEKTLAHVVERHAAERRFQVAVLGFTGSRLDHLIGNLNVLARTQRLLQSKGLERGVGVTCFDDHSVLRCLPRGETSLLLTRKEAAGSVGVWPLRPTRNLRSAGLRWDLGGGELFGFTGVVSSSNRAVGRVVEFSSDEPLIWTASFDGPFNFTD